MVRSSVQVLLVEQDEAIARTIRDALERCPLKSFAVRHVTSLADARSAAHSEAIDAVLVETMLPDSQGENTLTALLDETRGRIPIIVLTETEDSELMLRSLQMGAQDAVVKRSFSDAHLWRTIQFAIERRRLEMRLREQARVIESVISTIPHFVFWKDRESRYLGCNRQFALAAGFNSPEEIVGKDDYAFGWTKEESDFYRECDRRVMDSDTPMLNIEETQNRADGQELTILTSKVPLKNDDGVVIGILGMFLDITDRRRLEQNLEERSRILEETNEKLMASQMLLVQSEKMASLGQLAAGVAHDINNPIGFVLSNLRTLADYLQVVQAALDRHRALAGYLADGQAESCSQILADIARQEEADDLGYVMKDAGQLLAESLDGANRIKEIVQNLRSFARLDKAQVAEVDLNKNIDSTLNIVASELKYKCTVTKDYGELPEVRCYPGQLNQVFMNLLVNAGQAIEECGDVAIKTWADDEHVHIRISDTGQGVAPENLSRLFDPFFTTKPVGKGTGLGLSVSYGIVQKHGGRISVESKVGEGSVFTVSLPRAGVTVEEEEPAVV